MRSISLVLCLFAFGCSAERPVAPEAKIDFISEYEYERALGQNAAVLQFASWQSRKDPEGFDLSKYEGMIVDLSGKTVVSYASSEDEDPKRGYADGYHEALDLLYTNTSCTRY